MFYFLIHLILF